MRFVVAACVATLLAGCGNNGEAFANGRACRNVERLIAAVQVGDTELADEELDRLTSDSEVEERIDADELTDAVDDDEPEAIDDAVSGLDCDDLDIDVDAIDPTTPTDPTDPTDPTAPPDPTVPPIVPPTDPTTPTSGGVPPFTLPPAPTDPSVPDPSDPTTPGPSDPTAPRPTDPTSPTTEAPDDEPLTFVDVDAEQRPPGGENARSIREWVDVLGLTGSIAPAGPNFVESVYVSHGLGAAARRYEEVIYQVTTELPQEDVLARFRAAVADRGEYEFTETQSDESISFDTSPSDPAAAVPNWTVTAYEKEQREIRIQVVRSEYGTDPDTRLGAFVAQQVVDQLSLLEGAEWPVTAYTYFFSVEFGDEPYESVSLTYDVGDEIDPARELLLDELGPDAELVDDTSYVTINTDAGTWVLSDLGGVISGTFTTY